MCFFFCKQKTAYDMRISDWSSDVCSSDLLHSAIVVEKRDTLKSWTVLLAILTFSLSLLGTFLVRSGVLNSVHAFATDPTRGVFILIFLGIVVGGSLARSEEHTSELQSLMRISYAVFCLKKKKKKKQYTSH